MKVVISGYYGFGNTGDEAILEAIISELRKNNPDIRITVLSADPKETSKTFNVRSVRRFNLPFIIKEIMSCDTLISGGGGLLQDSTGCMTIPYYLGIIYLGLLFKKKVVVMGQGYGPVKSLFLRGLIRSVLNRVTIITVRDFKSFVDLQRNRVNRPLMLISADPTLLLEPADIEGMGKTENIDLHHKPLIGVCIRPLKEKSLDLKSRLAAALDHIAEKYKANILFIPFQLPIDGDESANIASLMKHKARIVTRLHAPRQLMGLIGKTDILIGMRLHSLIFASAVNVPMIGIGYDPKVDMLMKETDCPLLGLDFSADDIIKAFEELYLNRAHYSTLLRQNARTLQKRSRLNFSAFFEFANPMREFYLFGVKINNVDIELATDMIEKFIKSGKAHLVFTPNPEIIMTAQKDKELRSVLNSADLGIPDGIGIVGAAKLLNINISERVTGIDLMMKILERAKESGSQRVFLLGSAPGVADEAAKRLVGVNVVGTHHGYFKSSEEKEIIHKIKAAKPDILFVGLGAPRQEKWLAKNFKELGVPVSMVIGGSLDVLSGRVKRAPQLVQNLGIEWLYRLAKEPKRVSRQVNLLKFMAMAVRQKMLIR